MRVGLWRIRQNRTEHVPTLSENMSIQNQDMSTEKRPNSGRFDRLESHQSHLSNLQLNSSRFTLQTLNFRSTVGLEDGAPRAHR